MSTQSNAYSRGFYAASNDKEPAEANPDYLRGYHNGIGKEDWHREYNRGYMDGRATNPPKESGEPYCNGYLAGAKKAFKDAP